MLNRCFAIIAAAALASVLSCNPVPNGEQDEPDVKAEFTAMNGLEDRSAPAEGESFGISFTATARWESSAPSWMTVTPPSGEAGSHSVEVSVSAAAAGEERSGFVRFTCGADSRSMLVSQVSSMEPVPEDLYLDSPFSDVMHYSTGRLRTTSAVMQSFDIAKDGTIFYTQLNSKFRVYLSWGPRNGRNQPSEYMTLNFTGHGSNFTIEEDANGRRWLWMDNYSSKNASGEYWGAQIVSRFPVRAGSTLNPADGVENYYFGESNISVAVDFEGDMLTILGISTGRIRTYSLSALRALPEEDITLDAITYGGESGAPVTERTVTPVVKARNATKVTPLGDFSISRGKYADGSTISWQGFDIHGGLVYQAQGNGHADGTPSPGWVQVRKIDGTTVVPLTTIKALEDLKALKDAGITDTGYMEPEGVKWRNGLIYCGFASKNSANERRGTIFNYNPALVR